MIGSIWSRYILKELLKVVGLLLFAFYFLYVLIDYSSHAKTFQKAEISFFQTTLYYLFQLSRRLDLLLPLSMMIGVVKVVISSNCSGELTAMRGGGISPRKLFSPLLFAGVIATSFLYINTEWLAPRALLKIQTFEENFFGDRDRRSDKQDKVQQIRLQDGSILIYQTYHPIEKSFFDLYWIKNTDELYRIKKLVLSNVPTGHQVDHIVRNAFSELSLKKRYETLVFPNLQFTAKEFTSSPPDTLPLSFLVKEISSPFKWKEMSHRDAKITSIFFYKILIPLNCLLAILIPLPFVSRFSRSFPVFLSYAFAMIAALVFFCILNASLILTQSKVFPIYILFIPFAIPFLFFGFKYIAD